MRHLRPSAMAQLLWLVPEVFASVNSGSRGTLCGCRYPSGLSFSNRLRSEQRDHGTEGATRRSGSDQHRQVSTRRVCRGCKPEAWVGPVRSRIVPGRGSGEIGMSQQCRSDCFHGIVPRTRSQRDTRTAISERRGRGRQSCCLSRQLRSEDAYAPKRTTSHRPSEANCRKTQVKKPITIRRPQT